MNCENFQNEFELRSALSSDAAFHLDSCAGCQQHTRLLEMLGGLDRVEVPKDFDFQLNARIARGRPSNGLVRLFPSMQFVLPLALIVFVISVVALSGLFYTNRSPVEPVAINDVAVPNESNKQIYAAPAEEIIVGKNEVPPSETESGNSSLAANKLTGVTKKIDETNRNLRTAPPNPTPDVDEGGGSRDSAVRSTPPLIQPEFDSNRKVEGPAIPRTATVTKLGEVWNLIGITVDGFKVTGVGKSSVAERSGVKIGDVIQAIDGKNITTDSISDEQINVRSITVVRKGAKQEIPLKNN
jgi:membrane-associated protease RseP (regulator of RpoE activity)